MANGNGITVGDAAPDFDLSSTTGETVRLSDFRGRANVVLFFYPKDDSPACSTEACSFRDSYQDFKDLGAEVIGISSDSTQSHGAFADKFRLPYTLLSDPDGAVRKRFGVPKTLGLIPGRTTYVIDRQGTVRKVFSSQFQPAKHISEAIDVLKTLQDSPGT